MNPPTAYAASVATTWDISFQQVRKESPPAADLLNLMAFLGPEDIPRDLFAEGAKHLPRSLRAAVQDELQYDDALAALRTYSLAEVTTDAMSMHRLVQMVTRDRLKPAQRKKWARTAVCLLDAAYPFEKDDPGTWPRSLAPVASRPRGRGTCPGGGCRGRGDVAPPEYDGNASADFGQVPGSAVSPGKIPGHGHKEVWTGSSERGDRLNNLGLGA